MSTAETVSNFIHTHINEDLASGRYDRVHTRFPPEPNGYMHIGHAKAILLNYATAELYGGKFNLRFDDTNPVKEETEFVEAIIDDIHWLGADWQDRLFFTSGYFERLYQLAEGLILGGKAYVCDLDKDQTREYRGTLTEAGQDSPYRDRSVEENLDLFRRMRAGEFPEGSRVLRAKIDMSSPNINMRDPVLYRIMHAEHHRTGAEWCVYPMYDYSHPLSDAFEGITHSLCSIEYDDHRPLYDWFLENTGFTAPDRPRQIEFARLNLTYTVMSKRKLLKLVQGGHVAGWDDPRMPTIAGLRRRGYTTSSIQDFAERIGVARADSTVDLAVLEHCIREELNSNASRIMAVLKPLKVVITNYPEDQTETLHVENNPENPDAGSREVPFCREVYIEADDFMEDPPRKFFRLVPGGEVRLKGAYIIRCDDVIKDADGNVVELRCSYDPDTRSGGANSGKKVKGTLHWVSARHAVQAEVRLYDNLFTVENPGATEDFASVINPDSLTVLNSALVEQSVADMTAGTRFQFMRQGYFFLESVGQDDLPVFNRIVGLKDTWSKMQKA
ncbi:MAG TPA: glutamine--tRNA ligase/YqeY domain fusion protein [Bacillota bacterium]|nr:glutamine--tRNA ligase/YqeY domain fusion protein [Bacillota bacterium]